MTILELLVTLAVVGILAAVAMPRYATARERALVVTMQADLAELRLAQEAYRTSDGHLEYAGNVDLLGDRFVAAPDVTVEILASGPGHWAAVARHERTAWTCLVSAGTGAIDCAGDGFVADGGERGSQSGWEVR